MRVFTRRVIYRDNAPYLVRYTLISCRWFAIFVHCILRSDPDPYLHDHPWDFWTLLLWGRYREHRLRGPRDARMGTLIRHSATDLHRIEVTRGPVWTLFVHGPRYRPWGFATHAGWTYWKHYFEELENEGSPPNKSPEAGGPDQEAAEAAGSDV